MIDVSVPFLCNTYESSSWSPVIQANGTHSRKPADNICDVSYTLNEKRASKTSVETFNDQDEDETHPVM